MKKQVDEHLHSFLLLITMAGFFVFVFVLVQEVNYLEW